MKELSVKGIFLYKEITTKKNLHLAKLALVSLLFFCLSGCVSKKMLYQDQVSYPDRQANQAYPDRENRGIIPASIIRMP